MSGVKFPTSTLAKVVQDNVKAPVLSKAEIAQLQSKLSDGKVSYREANRALKEVESLLNGSVGSPLGIGSDTSGARPLSDILAGIAKDRGVSVADLPAGTEQAVRDLRSDLGTLRYELRNARDATPTARTIEKLKDFGAKAVVVAISPVWMFKLGFQAMKQTGWFKSEVDKGVKPATVDTKQFEKAVALNKQAPVMTAGEISKLQGLLSHAPLHADDVKQASALVEGIVDQRMHYGTADWNYGALKQKAFDDVAQKLGTTADKLSPEIKQAVSDIGGAMDSLKSSLAFAQYGTPEALRAKKNKAIGENVLKVVLTPFMIPYYGAALIYGAIFQKN